MRSAAILPGETGIRNLLRGDGYFGIDASIGKSFQMPFGDRLRFRWDVFNLTNTRPLRHRRRDDAAGHRARRSAATTAR